MFFLRNAIIHTILSSFVWIVCIITCLRGVSVNDVLVLIFLIKVNRNLTIFFITYIFIYLNLSCEGSLFFNSLLSGSGFIFPMVVHVCRHYMWPGMSTWKDFILVLNNLLTFVACEGPFGVSPWCCTSPYKCRLGLRSSFSTLVLGLSCVPKSIGITIKFWHNIIHKSMNANN